MSPPNLQFLKDFKKMSETFESLYPPNNFRAGNGIKKEIIAKFKDLFKDKYDPKILRCIAMKFIRLKLRKINALAFKKTKSTGKLMTTRSYKKIGQIAANR